MSQQLAEKTKPPAWDQSCAIPWAVGFDLCQSAEPQTFSSGVTGYLLGNLTMGQQDGFSWLPEI